ncbi:hypothetical protein WMY93_031359 [Mugilogobius chulae]|uniref:Uncharacterized protein n=1 Tax=Mugilogobius chulae TaxID=88201 RepID=A0AAW0MG27_9GOBI
MADETVARTSGAPGFVKAEASEGLRTAALNVSDRVCALELRASQGGPGGVASTGEASANSANTTEGKAVTADCNPGADRPALVRAERSSSAENTGKPMPPSETPKWSTVAKRGERQRQQQREQAAAAATAAKPVTRHHPSGQRKGGKTVVGTGATGSIKMIKTKLVSVFASKFSPDLEAETLRTYLSDKLGHDVTFTKLRLYKTGMLLLK